MSEDIIPDWIGLDLQAGVTHAYAMRDGRALDRWTQTGARDLANVLAALLQRWTVTPDTPIIACGVQDKTAPEDASGFRTVPCAPLGGEMAPAMVNGFTVYRVPGLHQNSPADLMQGSETRIAGFVALNPNWDGVICLPDAQTIWAQVSAKEVVSFQSSLTGEMAALLAQTFGADAAPRGETLDHDAFDAAVQDALSKPEKLAARLAGIRTALRLTQIAPRAVTAQLWGSLIGAELASTRAYWLGTQIALIGVPGIVALYRRALASQGASATIADQQGMTLAGLTEAYRHLRAPQ